MWSLGIVRRWHASPPGSPVGSVHSGRRYSMVGLVSCRLSSVSPDGANERFCPLGALPRFPSRDVRSDRHPWSKAACAYGAIPKHEGSHFFPQHAQRRDSSRRLGMTLLVQRTEFIVVPTGSATITVLS